jgi:hypothetical protein
VFQSQSCPHEVFEPLLLAKFLSSDLHFSDAGQWRKLGPTRSSRAVQEMHFLAKKRFSTIEDFDPSPGNEMCPQFIHDSKTARITQVSASLLIFM